MIPKSGHRRARTDINSSARITPDEPLPVEQQDKVGSIPLPKPVASAPQQPTVENSGSVNIDALEDSDEIRAWARNHPQRAREWLVHAAEGAKRDAVAEAVCLQLAETNPAAAVTLADGYGAGCSNVLENVVMQWADQDIQAASKWAATKQPGAQRDSLLSRIAFVESKTYPENAAALVAELIPPGPIQNEAAISVLYQWAQQDPNAAMKWAQTFSAGTLRDRAVIEVQNVMASNSK
jgi:hypothetical protein